ncbi:hypothetical protein ACWCOW_38590 [Streptomyces sp. NPDC001939]
MPSRRRSWTSSTAAPVGLVNLSTRTSGISLERLYFDCARLLDTDGEEHLRRVWSAGGSTQHRLAELLQALGERPVVILMDNVEDLLLDDGGIADPDLAVLLDWLFRAGSGPRLLVTSQIPVRLAPELRRFAAQVTLSKGLSPPEAATLLRERRPLAYQTATEAGPPGPASVSGTAGTTASHQGPARPYRQRARTT